MKYGRDHAKGPIRKEGNKRGRRVMVLVFTDRNCEQWLVGFDRNPAMVRQQPTAVEYYLSGRVRAVKVVGFLAREPASES